MAEEVPMVDLEITTTDERLADEASAEAEAAEAEAAEAPAVTVPPAATTTVTAAATDDSDGTPPEQVVDLGALESLESLFENIGASWSAALEDGALAESGACSAAVHEQALKSSVETLRSFIATVGSDDPLTFDARFTRRDDGTAVIIYAAPPDCAVGTYELPGS